jgi:hypothetical protein
MTDARPDAVALPGEPAGWRATLRDLLRHLRAESPDREAVLEWLREASASHDAAGAQLSLLEAAGLVAVDGGDERVRPGPAGREFLDTHDEGVLYEAVAGAVGGLGTLLESLAVRPLTDVEFRDLLERELDADPGPERVRARRQWLQALGYLDHDDGVNELTRAGRRRVETDDDLTPPRTKGSGGGPAAPGGAPSDHRPGTAKARDGAAQPSNEAAQPRDGASQPSDGPSQPSDGAAKPGEGTTAPEGSNTGPPSRPSNPGAEPEPTAGAEGFESLKRRYDHTCMVCGDRRQRSPGEGYALVHHPMPTGGDHGGPAATANAVVVCPNHRADFRHGLLRVDPQTREIEHAYEAAVSGRTLEADDDHDLGAQYLAYHDAVVTDF